MTNPDNFGAKDNEPTKSFLREERKSGPLGSSSSHGPLSQLDVKILELNRAGKSTRAIARAINKPRTTVQRILDRLSQDPNNGVKDNSRNAIGEGKWFKIIQTYVIIPWPSRLP